MVTRLLHRDWLLHGRAVLVNFGLFAAFQVYFILRVDSARAWLVFASIFVAFLSLTVFATEDKFRCAAWTLTLPVTRRDVVRARFLAAWLLVGGGLAVGVILAAVMPGSRFALAEVFRPETLLLAATTVTLIIALMLPFLVRFGLMGLMIFLVGAQIVGTGALLFAVASRGSKGGGISLGLTAIGDAVRAAHVALPSAAFDLLVVAVLLAANWAGYRLAVHLFRRREF